MKLDTKELQKRCAKLFSMLTIQENVAITNTLDITTVGNTLYMALTNLDYYLQTSIDFQGQEVIDACIDAGLFLQLIANTTSAQVEITQQAKSLSVKGNGSYEFNLILKDDGSTNHIPKIEITNKLKTFDIDKAILKSISIDNSKELQKGTIQDKIQRYFYIDKTGAITFTTGACINSFTLADDIKILVNSKVIKGFKLFDDSKVHFVYGEDNGVSKITLYDSLVSFTAMTNNDQLANFPVDGIRQRAVDKYPYSITIDKNALIEALTRRMLFMNPKESLASKVSFDNGVMTIGESGSSVAENVTFTANGTAPSAYSCSMDIGHLKKVVEGHSGDSMEIHFGNTMCFVFLNGSITNVVPEINA